jgi:hypothetical protein
MADDLSINVARSMIHMLASRTSSEVSVKLIKMRAQQDQALVAMLDAQVASLKGSGYDANGTSVVSAGPGSVDALA